MIVVTQFEINDKVFFIRDRRIVTGFINVINTVTVDPDRGCSTYKISYGISPSKQVLNPYHISDKTVVDNNVDEKYVFKTKQELLNSL